jgi:DNA modification methylase
MTVTVLEGDSRAVLATLPDASVQCCVTSPPYFGLRDYGHDGQIGLEATPEAYVAEMVALFREVRRVLKDDGTLWLNLGDSYVGGGGFAPDAPVNAARRAAIANGETHHGAFAICERQHERNKSGGIKPSGSLKAKDMVGIPWRVAFALQADGWYLRSDIIWHKPNPMPESVTDRPTKAHEYVFLLTKSPRYFYDAAAIAEEATGQSAGNTKPIKGADQSHGRTRANLHKIEAADTRNARTVWSITTQPFKGAHFATMPPELARRCILAGSRIGDTVLDPFGGAGTTGLVADRLGRDAVLIELNPTYAALARDRIHDDAPMFAEVV